MLSGRAATLFFELTTLGGDADLARRIALEVKFARARLAGRFLFFGKSAVYSAGITIMSAFPCRDRWLSADASLLIHGRKLEENVALSGPIRASLPMVEALLAEFKVGIALEEEGFRDLVDGCGLNLAEVRARALHNWYLGASEALDLGLVGGIVPLPGSRP